MIQIQTIIWIIIAMSKKYYFPYLQKKGEIQEIKKRLVFNLIPKKNFSHHLEPNEKRDKSLKDQIHD